MKSILSVFAVCVALTMISCGGDDDCSGDYVGDWTGDISCSGQDAAPITISISQIMGDTLAVNSNGEMLTGILDGCDLTLIPTEVDLSIFGTITISGSFDIIGDELTFTQMREAGGESEVCTFIGAMQ